MFNKGDGSYDLDRLLRLKRAQAQNQNAAIVNESARYWAAIAKIQASRKISVDEARREYERRLLQNRKAAQ